MWLQMALRSFSFDWISMLTSDLGLSELGFQSLLFNRHDIRDNAELDESEQRCATVLRRKFDPNTASDSLK